MPENKSSFSLEIYGVVYKGFTANITTFQITQDAILTVNGSIEKNNDIDFPFITTQIIVTSFTQSNPQLKILAANETNGCNYIKIIHSRRSQCNLKRILTKTEFSNIICLNVEI